MCFFVYPIHETTDFDHVFFVSPWTVGQVFVAFDGLSPQLVSHQVPRIRGPPTLLLGQKSEVFRLMFSFLNGLQKFQQFKNRNFDSGRTPISV